MATYKVLQDIEAEDKLLGPLTLRQFVYAAIVVVLGFISFKLGQINILLSIPFLLPMLFFGMLAAPIGQDQSSEVWLLAKIRFYLKPRLRIWNQDGVQELVTITAPKKIERHLANDLSQTEVKSRLHALASTLDSRGWVVKNVNVNLFSQPSYAVDLQADSDRLVSVSSLPTQDSVSTDVQATDDILDETSNPTAQHLDNMIHQSTESHRQAVRTQVQQPAAQSTMPAQADNQWFTNQPQQPVPDLGSVNSTVVPAVVDTAEQQVLEKIHAEQARPNPAYGHTRTLQPLDNRQLPVASQATDDKIQGTTAASVNPDILRLANNDDLNVDTIAREANRKQPPDDEVVISLR